MVVKLIDTLRTALHTSGTSGVIITRLMARRLLYALKRQEQDPRLLPEWNQLVKSIDLGNSPEKLGKRAVALVKRVRGS